MSHTLLRFQCNRKVFQCNMKVVLKRNALEHSEEAHAVSTVDNNWEECIYKGMCLKWNFICSSLFFVFLVQIIFYDVEGNEEDISFFDKCFAVYWIASKKWAQLFWPGKTLLLHEHESEVSWCKYIVTPKNRDWSPRPSQIHHDQWTDFSLWVHWHDMAESCILLSDKKKNSAKAQSTTRNWAIKICSHVKSRSG